MNCTCCSGGLLYGVCLKRQRCIVPAAKRARNVDSTCNAIWEWGNQRLYTQAYIYTYKPTCLHVYLLVLTYICAYKYIHAYIMQTYTYIQDATGRGGTHIHTDTRMHNVCVFVFVCVCVCVCVCMRACIRIMLTYTYMQDAAEHIYRYTYIYRSTYTYIYTHTYMQEDTGSGCKDGVPLFLFCHANGFCKEVWRPVVDELSKVA